MDRFVVADVRGVVAGEAVRCLSQSVALDPHRGASSRSVTGTSDIAQEFGEHDGVVVLAVAGGVEDCQPASCGVTAKLVEAFGLGGKLVAIANPKLRESIRDMVEPLAQLVAWSKLARPLVEAGAFVRDAARPDVVDEHPVAVPAVGRVIDPLGTHIDRHRRSLPSARRFGGRKRTFPLVKPVLIKERDVPAFLAGIANLEADLVCVGSHGTSRAAGVLFGSVA